MAELPHAADCDWHVDQYPHECTCGRYTMSLLVDLHEAFCEMAEMRRLATQPWERERAAKAHAVRQRVEAFFGTQSPQGDEG